MAQGLELFNRCPQCHGTGSFKVTIGAVPIVCNWPGCVDGYISFSKTTLDPGIDDVIDKCNDILDKCNDILGQLSG